MTEHSIMNREVAGPNPVHGIPKWGKERDPPESTYWKKASVPAPKHLTRASIALTSFLFASSLLYLYKFVAKGGYKKPSFVRVFIICITCLIKKVSYNKLHRFSRSPSESWREETLEVINSPTVVGTPNFNQRGVEQWKLVRLITWRSSVQIRPPQ